VLANDRESSEIDDVLGKSPDESEQDPSVASVGRSSGDSATPLMASEPDELSPSAPLLRFEPLEYMKKSRSTSNRCTPQTEVSYIVVEIDQFVLLNI
jgi:hypothetical protein